MTEQAKRNNQGKLRFSLLPRDLLWEVVKVLEMGAKKYGENNWRAGQPISQCYDSFERHYECITGGETFDEESGCYHGAHMVCNALFILWEQVRHEKKRENAKVDMTLAVDRRPILDSYTQVYMPMEEQFAKEYNIPFHAWIAAKEMHPLTWSTSDLERAKKINKPLTFARFVQAFLRSCSNNSLWTETQVKMSEELKRLGKLKFQNGDSDEQYENC